jgi:hypothetical protein
MKSAKNKSYSKLLKTEGVKYDDGKVRWELLPFDAINEIAKVMTFGAMKYDEHNWAKGKSWSRAYGAMMRHMVAWCHGQDKDPEMGTSHLANAGCCLFFLLAWELRGAGSDDRYKLDESVLNHLSKLEVTDEFKKMLNEYQKGKK